MSLLLDGRSLWLAETNCYVVARDSGGPCIVIDAPAELDAIAALLAEHDLYPEALLLTHAHVDHAGGAGDVVDQWAVKAFLHPDDEWLAADPMAQLRSLFGGLLPDWLDGRFDPPSSWSSLQHGMELNLAGIDVDVLHTPGHTPGHCCFHIADEGILFSGDQLFAGSIGRTDLPGGDYKQLMQSMQDHVLALADDTAVLPGHGPTTTISRERLTNPFLAGL
ncbi:MAG: MBL fold metallo-hydrolase [Acidimicrobiia bacterium]|nr:MBL fold metallo-hydrolase [Acidimicrobiia bacterium]